MRLGFFICFYGVSVRFSILLLSSVEVDVAEPPLILVGPPVSLRLRFPNGTKGVGGESQRQTLGGDPGPK